MGYLLAFVLYTLMGITDYFDGYLARSSGAVSKLGIFLDPIADKIMVASVLLVLTAQGVLRGPYVRSEEHTSELQSLMRISYAVFCLKKKIYILCFFSILLFSLLHYSFSIIYIFLLTIFIILNF